MTAFIIFISTFVVVVSLGLQSLNVNGGHKLAATITSLIIGSCNLALLKIMPQPTGYLEILAYLTGGPIGIYIAMVLHPWLVKQLKK